ncbi:MAG: hypothetical protein ACKO0Z_14245 [Betaproteobacteria bacterium]
MNRLSPYNISDPLVRAYLYREWREGSPNWDQYELSLDEIAMPEKVALRYHGTPNAKLTVAVCAGLDDLRDTMQPAKVVALPSNTAIRERIRYYEKLGVRLEELNGNG